MIEVPEALERETIGREGDASRRWLDALPGLADEFLQAWDCTPTGPVAHGRVGLVIPVRRKDGMACALKLSFPHDANIHEPVFLETLAGNGCVLLHERDDARFAMLLEQARQVSLESIPDHEAVAIGGALAWRLAVPAAGVGLPRLSDRAAEWEEEIRKYAVRFAQVLSERCVDAALATVRELAYRQPDTLVHADLHYGNVLSAERVPRLAVDPKGAIGDPAHDAVTVLARGARSLLAAGDVRRELLYRLAIFADAAGLEPERARRWAQLRAVQYAQRGRDRGGEDWRTQVAEQLAELLVERG